VKGKALVHGEPVEILGMLSASWMVRIFEPYYWEKEVYWIARGNRIGWTFVEYITWV
jgi:hypothetical protein